MTPWQSVDRVNWIWLLLGIAILCAAPLVTEIPPTDLIIFALLALSLGIMWGYAGVLSFGHAAYFGLGAYTYAVGVLNIGESTLPFLLAMLVPAIVAAVFGAMVFYGRISDVYMGVITLVFTLILFNFMRATAGDAYKIGSARLGGFNGMPGFPVINLPGNPEMDLFAMGEWTLYYITVASLVLCYLICRWILARSFGRVLIGIRENEDRCELMGYNVPAYKTAVFAISAAMAGLAGCLFANQQEIITPHVFSLAQTAEILIWVIVGGLGTLIGPIVGAIALSYIKILIGTPVFVEFIEGLFGKGTKFDNSLVLGAFLIIIVLVLPSGIVPAIWRLRDYLTRRTRRRPPRGAIRRRLNVSSGTRG